MMHDFLNSNRDELTRRCRFKVSQRHGRDATDVQLANGVPMFLDQLIRTLQVEQTDLSQDSRKISGASGGGTAVFEVSTTAAHHRKALMLMGFSVNEVVHDYRDLCLAITDLGFERDLSFAVDEFRTLNRCLDNAIADAVIEFGYHREMDIASKYDANANANANEEKGIFAHELRNLIHNAQMAFDAARLGNLSLSGATGAVLARSLSGLRVLVDRSLSEVRQETQGGQSAEEFSLAEFIDEIRAAGTLAAKVRGCLFVVTVVDPTISIRGTRELLFSAVWNLLQNAFKFTHVDTKVSLTGRAVGDRILIDITDHCGGIDPSALLTIFDAFSQSADDRSGLGLGLAIAQKCVVAHDGTLTVVNTQGVGCTFTVNLPRHTLVH